MSSSRAWSWRHAVAEESNLPPTTRLVLHTLGIHMDETGRSCFPSIAQLTRETGLDKKTVLKHLDQAKEAGWVEISRHGYGGQRWKRNEYSARWPGRDVAGSTAPTEQGGGTAPPPSGSEAAEGGGGRPPASAEKIGDKVVEMTPEGGGAAPPKAVEEVHHNRIPESSHHLSSEREGRDRDDGKKEGQQDDPSKFFERVRRMELGSKGAPKWFGAESGSTEWSVRQFAALTDDERRQAEERRDAFLACCPKDKDGNPKPCSLGIYFRDKKFQTVSPGAVQAGPNGGRVPVAPFGPIWAGMRALALLAGPVAVEIPEDLREQAQQTFDSLRRRHTGSAYSYLQRKGIRLTADGSLEFPEDFYEAERRRRIRDEGYPEVRRLHEQAKDRERSTAEGRFGALADLCEAVTVDSELYQRWADFHEERGWPFVPDPGTMPVVWFPKGGPEALEEFRTAAQAAVREGETQ